MKQQSQNVFEQLVEKPQSTKKWLFFPVSLVFHGLLVVAVIVVPLLSITSDIPPVKIVDVFLAAHMAPSVPTFQVDKKGSDKPNRRQENNEPKPADSGRLVEPVEIPTEIPNDPFDGIPMGEGSSGGVVGGIDGGIDVSDLGRSGLFGDGANPLNHAPISIVQKARPIKRVNPDYPSTALRAHIEGVVIVEAVTDVYGKVVGIRVISGHALLKQAAVDAVKQWVYAPHIVNGMPRPVTFTVNVTFSLQR
jgi:periplasmic protein TonB